MKNIRGRKGVGESRRFRNVPNKTHPAVPGCSTSAAQRCRRHEYWKRLAFVPNSTAASRLWLNAVQNLMETLSRQIRGVISMSLECLSVSL